MVWMHFCALLAICMMALCYHRIGGSGEKDGGKIFSGKMFPLLLFGAALLLRILCACVSKGFNTDINCFSAWAERLRQVGPGGFYSSEIFTDYPPGFLYYLYFLGSFCHRLGIPWASQLQIFLIKLPSILCDMACGALLYREAGRRLGHGQACFVAAVYLFQPAVILDSAVWGQVDSILTLALVVMCLMLMKGNLPAAYIAFGLGVLLKPQMLVFSPVLIVGILDQVFLKEFSWKKLGYHILCGIETLAGMVILCMPFGLGKVLAQYISTLGEYPYAAVNACNFWGLLGKNWVSQEETFLFFSYRGWGMAVIAAIVIISLLIGLRRREDAGKYPLIAAFVIITMFMFSVRMHERYVYPCLAMLLLAYLYWQESGLYLCYGGFSLLCFYNMSWVLYYYDPADYDRKEPLILIVSACMLLCALYFYYLVGCRCGGRKPVELKFSQKSVDGGTGGGLKTGWEDAFRGGGAAAIAKADVLLMTVVTLIYAVIALRDLGDRQAPVTTYDMKAGEQIVLEFEEAPASLSYYIAPKQERSFLLETQENGGWRQAQEITLKYVFTWQEVALEHSSTTLGLISESEQVSILELCFKNARGEKILPLNAGRYGALFDEQELCPERSSFRNSMYFDEIYHGRTAYEYLNGLYSYENTHPPLGKILIAAGVALFGMNPFGWRIAGTLFGILMVPLAYLFGKRFTGGTAGAFTVSLLYAFDFMHFTQTRIATIDVFVTFFVMLMYYFMFRYVSGCLRGTRWQNCLIPLGLCGVSMGLGVACKWTGVYAGAGLAVLFFLVLYWQYRNQERKEFRGQTVKTLSFCVLFFVCIPAAIYLLSYLPFVDGVHEGLVQRMLYNQQTMFNYHSKLESTHAFSSPWYQWPIMVRPIWYYSGVVSETVREGISAFGNPLVWWLGIPALLYMIYRIFRHRDGKALFLVIAYLAQYLPWMLVSRLTFIYHYFPSVIFVVLMIVYGLQCLTGQARVGADSRAEHRFSVCCLICALIAVGLFLLFYPVLSGAPVEVEFVKHWLRWGPGWVLVSG